MIRKIWRGIRRGIRLVGFVLVVAGAFLIGVIFLTLLWIVEKILEILGVETQ